MSLAWRYLSSRRRLPTSISRPRREWWSLLCSRRWPVNSLIRSVIRATWTSAEPVSPPPRPCLPISSAFFSFVGLIEKIAAAPRRGDSRPLEASTDNFRLFDVAVHLRDQLLDAREPPFSA